MTGQDPTFTMPEGLLELQTALEETWPAHQAALRASGVPLNDDPEPDPKPDPKPDPAPDPKLEEKPPWGDDDFDAKRAWKLLQDTRGDRDKLKKEREALAAKVKEHDDASKTENQKAIERAIEAEKVAKSATLDAARLRVALKKDLTETQAKRLVGDTEAELESDADDLLASFKDEAGGGGGQGPQRRPKEKLRPGAAPESEPEETDPEKLAAQVPRMY